MKISLSRLLPLLLPAVLLAQEPVPAPFGPAPHRAPEVVRDRFDVIAGRLDRGGDVFVVANVEGLVEDVLTGVASSLRGVEGEPGRRVRQSVDLLDRFLKKNGFFAFRGFGFSSISDATGICSFKTFVARQPAAADAALWKAWFGTGPRSLDGMRYLPADTVVAHVSMGEPSALWSMLKGGVLNLGSERAVTAFTNRLARMGEWMGVSPDRLIDSLGDESFCSMQLSSRVTVQVPGPQGMLTLPQPALLVGIAVRNDALQNVLHMSLLRLQLPVTETVTDGITLRTVPLVVPSPVPLQFTWAQAGNYLLLGTMPEAVSEGLRAAASGRGLAQDAEFARLVAGLAATNNGIGFVSARFSAFLSDLQKQAVDLGAVDEYAQLALHILRELVDLQRTQASVFVTQNLEDGVLVTGRATGFGGRDLLAATLAAPLGMACALAGPAVLEAQQAARDHGCLNNLRLIDSAKELWQLEHSRPTGDTVTLEDLRPYLPGGTLPVCPGGGTYSLNAAGVLPACSVPGHALVNGGRSDAGAAAPDLR